ncbi:MAG: Crp/Fnr family transcriptional regulator [Ardenticatenaceae bacterium]|nr:Crp/Fnr family transcriptional regulator [Anaerolineales bacterium]MCB8917054.1 Crp/Fnr family transcriptional regulator [Ardenticatenaceae bacterium]
MVLSATEWQLIRSSKIFRNLADRQLDVIVQAARTYRVSRRDYFFHQGERATTFYVVLHGNVRLAQLTPEGRQVIIHYLGPGGVMGAVVVFCNADFPASAEAATDSVALGWDYEVGVALMEQFPRLAINSMEMVAERFWELQERYTQLATERVERRVARAILRLSQQPAGRNGGQNHRPIKITRQDIAEMTGTTLFTVSRICSRWGEKGFLNTGREQISILNLAELTAIAEDLSPSG